jgi:radical SAM protein with 4Fe4S-binding SPASM domain
MSEPCEVAEQLDARTGPPNPYIAILARSEKQHRLISVHWELTYRCNERCTHCYLDVLTPGAKVPGELSTAECKRVLDELAALGALTVTFSGGEPLVRADFFEIAGYARRKGFAVRLFTNGILIKPEIAERLAALRPVVVELSLYGADAASHDQITLIPGSFELTLRACDLLRARGVRTILKCPMMRENYRQMDALRALALAKGANFQYDLTIVPKHSGDRGPLRHRLSDDELLDLFSRELTPDGWTLAPYRDSYRFCGIGLTSLTIGPYGEVYSCVGARVSAGNVREQRLATLWQAPVWAELAGLTLANLPVCASCELRQYCVRCHGTAAFEDGDLLGCSSVAYREARLRRQVLRAKGQTDSRESPALSVTSAQPSVGTLVVGQPVPA